MHNIPAPLMAELVNQRAGELHQAARLRGVCRDREPRRPLRVTAGWWLVHLGLQLVARPTAPAMSR